MEKIILFEINEENKRFDYTSSIHSAINQAELEMETINETIESISSLRPNCDTTDYALAASSGVLCGVIDVFLVGKPGESPLGNITDKWFADRTVGFAKMLGWNPRGEAKVENAINWLEDKFDVPYDQTSLGDAAKKVFGLNTDASSHHFESLAHNPSILGLFFSILDQFTNSSHFVIDGRLIHLVEAKNKFKLEGRSFLSKLFCGIFNWLGHLISDVSGSYGSVCKGNRGMGIPSPLWTWINDIIVIKRKLGISESDFDRSMNKFAVDIFNEGFDMRFQTAQGIPVLLNELLVRILYTIRRMFLYYSNTSKGCRTIKDMWASCKPFGNPTISRMLTVAHSTFCLVDIGDATIRGFVSGGGNLNPVEFFLRVNLVGVGRFTISLFGEAKREFNYHKTEKEALLLKNEKSILENYIEGLNILKEIYDDKEYISFVDDLSNNEYILAFVKSATLAKKRGVPDSKVLKTKPEIDDYFNN